MDVFPKFLKSCIDFLFVMVYDIFENYGMFLRNESLTCVSTKHYF